MKRLMILIAGICTMTMISCSKDETNDEVQSITVRKNEITVCTKSAFNPVAFGLQIFPQNIGEEKLVYTTSDNSLVRLKEEESLAYRFFTGNKTGVATLTCASADGKHKADVRVNVVENPRYDIQCEKIAPSSPSASDGELKVAVSVHNKTNCTLKNVKVTWRKKFTSDSFDKEEIIAVKDDKFVFEKKGLPECVVGCSFRMEFEGLVDLPGRATSLTYDFMIAVPPVFEPEELVGNWYAATLDGFRFVDGKREPFYYYFKPEDSGKQNFAVYNFEIVNGMVKITISTNNADGSKATDIVEGVLQSGTKIETKEWRVEILQFSENSMICSFTKTSEDEGLVLHQSCELKKMSE